MYNFVCRVVSILILFVFISGANAAGRTALVVGNSAYPFGPLVNPANDAKLIAETLKKTGFEVTVVLDANRVTLQSALLEFSRDIRTKETVGLFYYAGHGAQVNGANYLIPVDADIKSESEVKIFAINVDEFVATLERADGRTNIVILDSCRNNPFGASTRSVNRGMALPDAPAGTFVALSTSPGAVALDGEGSNSPYAEALSQSMLEPNVSIEQAFKVTRRLVLQNTKQKQVPWETSSLTGDFYFLPQTQLAAPIVQTAPEPVVEPETPKVKAQAQEPVAEPKVALVNPPRKVELELTTTVIVNGANLASVTHDKGRFQKTNGGQWSELDADGNVAFTFEETGRDDWSVYLNDPKRDIQIQLDAYRKMVSFGQNNGPKTDLYPISDMLAVSEPPREPEPNPIATATGNGDYQTLDIQPELFPVGKWPEGLTIADNAIWVAESGSRRIVKIDPAAGDLLEAVNVGRLPVPMVSDPAGNVYTATYTDQQVYKQPPGGAKGKAIASFRGKSIIEGLAFGEGSVFVATKTLAGESSIVRIDPTSGKKQTSPFFPSSPTGILNGLIMVQDSLWMLYGGAQSTLTTFDMETLQPAQTTGLDGFVWSLGGNLDAVFAAGREDQTGGKSIIHRIARGNPEDKHMQILDSDELIMAVAANNDRVAALGGNGTIWILDASTLKPLKKFNSGREPRSAIFENGHLFITAHQGTGENGVVMVYSDVGKID